MRLDNKVILVTGSTTGIGEATARACVAEGARVVLHGLERELGEGVLRDLGEKAVLRIGNLSDPEEPRALVDFALTSFGSLDGIVNNAVLNERSTLADVSLENLDRTLRINLTAPLFLIQAALPHLARARGAVVNIGSINAYSGEPDLLAYSISKGALSTLTRNLGDVLHREHGVRVNQVNPGWVLTQNEDALQRKRGMQDGWTRDLDKAEIPSGDLIMPENIASVVVAWLADETRPFSGTIIDLAQFPVGGQNLTKVPGGSGGAQSGP